jgi:hypothetical protein
MAISDTVEGGSQHHARGTDFSQFQPNTKDVSVDFSLKKNGRKTPNGDYTSGDGETMVLNPALIPRRAPLDAVLRHGNVERFVNVPTHGRVDINGDAAYTHADGIVVVANGEVTAYGKETLDAALDLCVLRDERLSRVVKGWSAINGRGRNMGCLCLFCAI